MQQFEGRLKRSQHLVSTYTYTPNVDENKRLNGASLFNFAKEKKLMAKRLGSETGEIRAYYSERQTVKLNNCVAVLLLWKRRMVNLT